MGEFFKKSKGGFALLYASIRLGDVKRSEIIFGITKLIGDAFGIAGCLLLAYFLRRENIDLLPFLQLLQQSTNLPLLQEYIQSFVLPGTALYLCIAASLRLYVLRSTQGAWLEIGRVILTSLLWLTAILAWFSLIEVKLFFSRALLLQATGMTMIIISLLRCCIILLQRLCLRKGIGVRSVVSIGTQNLTENVRMYLTNDPRFHYIGHYPSLQALNTNFEGKSIDLVLHTSAAPESEETMLLIDYCRSHHFGYALLPPVFADVPHQLSIEPLGLVPILTFRPTPLDGWGRVAKRSIDILLSTLLLLMLLPLILTISIVILIINGRPIFYRSNRHGQHGTPMIPVLKFRTMIVDADLKKNELLALSHRSDGPLFKIKNDPRITCVGKVLRRWSFDELPQLFNVLCGQLSLVGPRPHLPEEVAQYSNYQRRVFAIRPGITGLAQVSGRSNLPFAEEVRLDLKYIEEWSLLLDFWILWRTLFVVVFGRGAD